MLDSEGKSCFPCTERGRERGHPVPHPQFCPETGSPGWCWNEAPAFPKEGPGLWCPQGLGRNLGGKPEGLDAFLAMKVPPRPSQCTICLCVCVLPSKSPSQLKEVLVHPALCSPHSPPHSPPSMSRCIATVYLLVDIPH